MFVRAPAPGRWREPPPARRRGEGQARALPAWRDAASTGGARPGDLGWQRPPPAVCRAHPAGGHSGRAVPWSGMLAGPLRSQEDPDRHKKGSEARGAHRRRSIAQVHGRARDRRWLATVLAPGCSGEPAQWGSGTLSRRGQARGPVRTRSRSTRPCAGSGRDPGRATAAWPRSVRAARHAGCGAVRSRPGGRENAVAVGGTGRRWWCPEVPVPGASESRIAPSSTGQIRGGALRRSPGRAGGTRGGRGLSGRSETERRSRSASGAVLYGFAKMTPAASCEAPSGTSRSDPRGL
jgi:hypothetical protein